MEDAERSLRRLSSGEEEAVPVNAGLDPGDDNRRLEREYEITEPRSIGEGTYGKVYKARLRRTGRIVAMKKMPVDWDEEGLPSTFFREIALLKALHCRYVVELLDVFASSSKIVLIFEFLDSDLKKFMRMHGNCLGTKLLFDLAWQLCLGVEFCHAHCVLHRDLKPQNLLIDHRQQQVQLKLADFGLAREYHSVLKKYTQEVVTVWYRAPELLLGSGLYSAPIDMWSVGCIVAEMAVGKPLFNGDSEIDTIFRIFKLLGSPSEETWTGIDQLPNFKAKFPRWPIGSWAAPFKTLQQLNPRGVELVESLLVYDPRRRLSAKHAVRHHFFEVATPAVPLPLSRQATPTDIETPEKSVDTSTPEADTQTPEKSVEEAAVPPIGIVGLLGRAEEPITEEVLVSEVSSESVPVAEATEVAAKSMDVSAKTVEVAAKTMEVRADLEVTKDGMVTTHTASDLQVTKDGLVLVTGEITQPRKRLRTKSKGL